MTPAEVAEDAAEATGSEYNGKKTGSFGLWSTFSFYIAHTVQAGEFGCICTNDDEIARIASIANDRSENIGARRLHTVMSTLLEDVLYELQETKRDKIVFTAKDVTEKLGRILADEDLTRYIL